MSDRDHPGLGRLLRVGALSLVLLATIGCDQLTKLAARSHVSADEPVQLLGGTLTLTLTENPGAFLSLGAALPARVRVTVLVFAVGAALLAGMIYLLYSDTLNRLAFIAGSLIVAGGLGNLIDRVLRSGCVTDFIRIGVGPFTTGIFNVADVAIMGGVALFIVSESGRHIMANRQGDEAEHDHDDDSDEAASGAS